MGAPLDTIIIGAGTAGLAALREVRWMCSFDTTESDVDEFASLIRQAVKTL